MSVYEIRVKGHLDPGWSEWFDGLEILNLENGEAALSGDIVDQAALLVAALADIYRHPAEEIKGSKWLWSAVPFVNFMGISPIAYFLFGRKLAWRRAVDTERKKT